MTFQDFSSAIYVYGITLSYLRMKENLNTTFRTDNYFSSTHLKVFSLAKDFILDK